MNDVNHNQKLEDLAIGCMLTNKLFEAEVEKPTIYLEPTRTKKEIAASDNWKQVYTPAGQKKNMMWDELYAKQLKDQDAYMCTVKDSVTHKIVGFVSGRHNPKDADGSRVSIDYVERDFNSTRSKGYMITIAMKFAYTWGFAKKAEYVKVNNPANGLEKYYQEEMPDSVMRGKRHRTIIAPIDYERMVEEISEFLPG